MQHRCPVANAGAAIAGPLGAITEEDFDAIIDVNMRGTLFTVQKALPLFNDEGSIVMTGSIAGMKGRVGRSVYAASKAALRSFVRTWASNLKDSGIRVNLISAGLTETAALANASNTTRDGLAALILRGRLGQPDEVANAVLFLASQREGVSAFRGWWLRPGVSTEPDASDGLLARCRARTYHVLIQVHLRHGPAEDVTETAGVARHDDICASRRFLQNRVVS
ncbi:hypothetical protein NK8_69810 (plasmid) [Caballeronia sp. NK8]|uniref:SDR family NAD(P)-dependent oxidoreductase n=1 Tax=Caballeronia sp. NK8 TaxID=140098 RepID=UPI001BB4D27E|nr:SDR family oxidoreductase [Caballeronia sp. NK8]BCQ28791.1 hypothetical protein NK8_69810 [Caballeronia sp. NK8]